jgi:tRNA(fMet)-specific endonuclease VapC
LNALLDSNACIELIRQRQASVRERALQFEAAGNRMFVSSISVFELWYGVAYSSRPEENELRLVAFLATIPSVAFNDEDAHAAGTIRADLRRRGAQIGPYDCLIAAQAVRRDFLLITANVSEFSRIAALRWENWTT